MIKFNRTAVMYDTLRKECLKTIRQWPVCETVAGIQLIRDNSPAGFSAKITLYWSSRQEGGRSRYDLRPTREKAALSLDRLKPAANRTCADIGPQRDKLFCRPLSYLVIFANRARGQLFCR